MRTQPLCAVSTVSSICDITDFHTNTLLISNVISGCSAVLPVIGVDGALMCEPIVESDDQGLHIVNS